MSWECGKNLNKDGGGKAATVSGHQCVRTSRSLGNAYNLDLCLDEGRVGLPRTRYGAVYKTVSPKCQDIGDNLLRFP